LPHAGFDSGLLSGWVRLFCDGGRSDIFAMQATALFLLEWAPVFLLVLSGSTMEILGRST